MTSNVVVVVDNFIFGSIFYFPFFSVYSYVRQMSIKERKIKIEPRLIESQQSNKEKNQELKKN